MEEQSLNKCFPEGEKCQGRENAGYISRGSFDFSLRTVSPPLGTLCIQRSRESRR